MLTNSNLFTISQVTYMNTLFLKLACQQNPSHINLLLCKRQCFKRIIFLTSCNIVVFRIQFCLHLDNGWLNRRKKLFHSAIKQLQFLLFLHESFSQDTVKYVSIHCLEENTNSMSLLFQKKTVICTCNYFIHITLISTEPSYVCSMLLRGTHIKRLIQGTGLEVFYWETKPNWIIST